MPRKSEQEWQIIEEDYITNPVTMQDLRKKYNISTQAIGYQSVMRNWIEKRKKILDKTCLAMHNGILKHSEDDKNNILSQIEKLIKLKSKAELLALQKYFELTDDGKNILPMEMMKLINKSKDGIVELTKLSELLKGNATDRVDFREDEKESNARKNRLEVLGLQNN